MQPASVNRRLAAAICDVSLVLAGWCALLLPLCLKSPAVSLFAWPRPGAILVILALLCLFTVETLTGRTLGKLIWSLRVRRPDGSPPTGASLAIRGAFKFLLALLCFLPLLPAGEDGRQALGWLAVVPLLLVFSTTYIGLIRRGQSAFDLAAATVVLEPDSPARA